MVLFLLMFFVCQQLSAQDSLLPPAADHFAAGYLTAVDHHAAIFSGNREQPLGISASNHPYFKEQNFTTGRLSLGGIIYPNLQLRWDLYKDHLIVLSPKNYTIAINNATVDFFEIHGYHIFNMHPDGLAGCPPAGYYILLHSTDHYVLIEKQSNYLQEDNVRNKRFNFTTTYKFFLLKNDVYYKIQNKKTLLKTLETHRKELNQFMRANNLKYKNDAEKTVYETVKEHEKLSRQ